MRSRYDHTTGEQLQDDRGADVRHDTERKDRHVRQIPAGEHVVEAEHGSPRLLRQDLQRFLVDAGRRDMAPDAIHAQQPEREQHAVAQVRDGKQVLDRVIHGFYLSVATCYLLLIPCYLLPATSMCVAPPAA
jgi:hypothetical protein